MSLVSDGYMPPDGSGVVVDIEHLPDMMAVCVATGRGDIILWNMTSGEVGNFLKFFIANFYLLSNTVSTDSFVF